MQIILVTGCNGLIGRETYELLLAKGHDVTGLDVSEQPSERLRAFSSPEQRPFVKCDISDAAAVQQVFSLKQFDMVVHLAADPREDAPSDLTMKSNIIGTQNILRACEEARVKRIVFGSSIMVSWGYWLHEEPYCSIRQGKFDQIDADDGVFPICHEAEARPTCLYAASKIFGEALCRAICINHKEEMTCFCIRFGAVNVDDDPLDPSWAALWLSKRDAALLVDACIEAPIVNGQFDIFYGVSRNKYCWVDIQHTKDVIGWEAKVNPDDILAQKLK